MYKDNEDYIHLFFYPGIDNNNISIYNEIELSNNVEYDKITYLDNSIDFKFKDKKIIKIICKFITKDNKEIIEELKIYR